MMRRVAILCLVALEIYLPCCSVGTKDRTPYHSYSHEVRSQPERGGVTGGDIRRDNRLKRAVDMDFAPATPGEGCSPSDTETSSLSRLQSQGHSATTVDSNDRETERSENAESFSQNPEMGKKMLIRSELLEHVERLEEAMKQSELIIRRSQELAKQLINEEFDQVVELPRMIVIDLSWIHTIEFYVVGTVLIVFFTSTSSPQSARISLVLLVILNALFERAIWNSYVSEQKSDEPTMFETRNPGSFSDLIMISRPTFSIVGIFLLICSMQGWQDYVTFVLSYTIIAVYAKIARIFFNRTMRHTREVRECIIIDNGDCQDSQTSHSFACLETSKSASTALHPSTSAIVPSTALISTTSENRVNLQRSRQIDFENRYYPYIPPPSDSIVVGRYHLRRRSNRSEQLEIKETEEEFTSYMLHGLAQQSRIRRYNHRKYLENVQK